MLGKIKGMFTPHDTSTDEGRVAERNRRAKMTAMMSMLAKMISVATQLISVPIALHYLGPERYGMWIVLSTFVIMLGFADLGIGNGILNSVAAAKGRNDVPAIRTALSGGFLAQLLIAFALLAIFLCSFPFVSWVGFFNVRSPLGQAEAGPTVLVFMLCFLVSIPSTIGQRVQTGMQQGFMAAVWTALGSALTLPAILIAIWFKVGLPVLVGVFVGIPILANVLNVIVYFGWIEPELRPSLRAVDRADVKNAVRQGLLWVAIQLGAQVTSSCVPMIISQVKGPEFVALYTVPERILAMVVLLSSMYVQPLWPAYREAIFGGDGKWVARSFPRMMMKLLAIDAVALVLLVIAMPTILHFWVHDAVRPSLFLLVGIAVYKLCDCLLWGISMVIFAYGELKFQSVVQLGGAVIYCILGVIACRHLGVDWIAWVGASVLFLVLIVPGSAVMMRRLNGTSARQVI